MKEYYIVTNQEKVVILDNTYSVIDFIETCERPDFSRVFKCIPEKDCKEILPDDSKFLRNVMFNETNF